MLEYSFPRLFVPWNIRSHDGTFILGTIRSVDHSFPIPNITCKIHSLDYNRSNTSFIVHVRKMMIFKAKVLALPVKNKIA